MPVSQFHQLEEIQAQQKYKKDVEEVYEYIGEVITPGIFIMDRIIENQRKPHGGPVIGGGAFLSPHREKEGTGIPKGVYLMIDNYIIVPDKAVAERRYIEGKGNKKEGEGIFPGITHF